MPNNAETTWESLPEFSGEIRADDQVLIIAMKGGAKSTLAATLTLGVPSLIAIDDKGRLTLPGAAIYDLPAWSADKQYDEALVAAIRWRNDATSRSLWGHTPKRATNRIILRVDPNDQDNPKVHNRIFRAVFLKRPDTILWIDEITATGATPQASPIFLRALSARGRTINIGMWTLTQAPYGMLPGVLKRNADITIVGPVSKADAIEMTRDGFDHAEIAGEFPTRTGKFLVRRQGDRQTYRLFVPIPRELRNWEAP